MIICDGQKRDKNNPEAIASKVKSRFLDPMPWAVTAYDNNNGQCTLTRGAPSGRFVDQYSIPEEQDAPLKGRTVSGFAYERRDKIRECALVRANGKCEWCSQFGFLREDGTIYLETHHVIPRSEGGADSVNNVVALCPNHHREAHSGAKRTEIRKTLLEHLAALYKV